METRDKVDAAPVHRACSAVTVSPLSDAHYRAIAETANAIQLAVQHVDSYYQSVHHKYADAMRECTRLLSTMTIDAE